MTGTPGDVTALANGAADGDNAAMQQVIGRLGSDTGTSTLSALMAINDSRLWTRLLEFASRGQSSADAGMTDADADAQRAHNAVAVAFTARRDAPAEPARQQALRDGLASGDPFVRAFAAELLGRRGGEGAVEGLGRLMDDSNDAVRVAAVRGIANQEPERALPYLLRALERFDVVSAEAVNGLVRLGAAAAPALIGELQQGNSWIRWHAARALGGIQDPSAVEPLINALTDDDAGVRWEAVHALSAMGPRVLDPLLRALSLQPVTPWFAESADRVLSRVAVGDLHPQIAPLQRMLHHLDAAVEVPVEAARVRQVLQSLHQS